MSKRKKINFGSINKGKYTVIDPEKIRESKKRINEHMKKFISDLKKRGINL